MQKLANIVIFCVLCLINITTYALADIRLTLDTQGHTGTIKDIAITSQKEIITASDDKTIRVFDSYTGLEKRKILGQINSGPEGRIYAMALSPDEKYLAVGGWLSHKGNNEYGNIRIYAYATGQLIKVLKSHQSVVNDLAFSQDSTLLISASSDWTAKIWNVKKQFVLKDTITYHNKAVHAVGLVKKGKKYFAITAGFDQIVALYDLKKRKIINSDSFEYKLKYLAVNYSKKHIAIGGFANEIIIYDEKLKKLTTITTQSKPKGLAYSNNGQLLLSGRDSKTNDVAIFNVEKSYKKIKSFQQHSDIAMAVAFLDDKTAVSAGGVNKEIILWDVNTGKVKRKIQGVGRPILNVAIDDNSIAWTSAPTCKNNHCNKLTKSISIEDFSVNNIAEKTTHYQKISTTRGKYSLKHTKGGEYQYDNAVLNIINDGKNKAQIVRNKTNGYRHISYGWYKDFIISGGANGQLTIYNKSGQEVASLVGHTGDIWSIAIHGDKLISGSEDQTMKIWSLHAIKANATTRKNRLYPILSVFAAANDEWVIWSQSGYFSSSIGGDKYAGYHINRGPNNAARYVGNDKYFETYYRPDVISTIWQTASEKKAIAFAGRNNKVQKIEIKESLPPLVSLLSKSFIETTQEFIDVKFLIDSDKKLEDTIILVNGIKINTRAIKFIANDTAKKVTVPLSSGDNVISIRARNQSAMSDPVTVMAIRKDAPKDLYKPNLYVLSIGVSEYQNSEYNLSYADDDARAISELFKAQKGKIYQDVIVKTLINDETDNSNLLDQLEWLHDEATSKDMVIIFLAGHGLKDKRGSYYFLGYNANKERIRSTGLKWTEIKETILGLPSKVLLLADTCHSGSILGGNTRDVTSAIKSITNTGSGAVVMAASTGTGTSQERSNWGHGAFTKSIIEGIGEMKADKNNNSVITVKELDGYVTNRVNELTEGAQKPTTIIPVAVNDFAISVK